MCSIFGLKKLPGHFISATILSACLISVSQAATFPVVPVLVKSGAGAIMRDTMYIGPGSAEKSWYRPDMRAREESRAKIADFPGAHGRYQKQHYYAHTRYPTKPGGAPLAPCITPTVAIAFSNLFCS